MDWDYPIKSISFVAYMFYAWSLRNNTLVPIAIKQIKYVLSLNTYTTVFAWRFVNSNNNRT